MWLTTLGSSRDRWPHLTVDVDISQAAAGGAVNLSRSHVYQLALAAKGASTIEYQGDAASGGGYDVCCNFVKASRRVLLMLRYFYVLILTY